jgi:peptide/nickel transport system permease protein
VLLLFGVTLLIYWVGIRAATVVMEVPAYAELTPPGSAQARMCRIRELAAAYTESNGEPDDAMLYELGVTMALVMSADVNNYPDVRDSFSRAPTRGDRAGGNGAPSASHVLAKIGAPSDFVDIVFYRAVAAYVDKEHEPALVSFRQHAQDKPASATGRLALANMAGILIDRRARHAKELREIVPELRHAIAATHDEETQALLTLRLGQVHIARHRFAKGAELARRASATAHPGIAYSATKQARSIENARLDAGYLRRMTQIARLDLGKSASGERVAPYLPVFFRNTLALAALATVVALAIAAPMGVVLAAVPVSVSARAIRWAVYLVSGVPAWLLGLVGLRMLSLEAQWHQDLLCAWRGAGVPDIALNLLGRHTRWLTRHHEALSHYVLAPLTLAFGNSLVSRIMQRVRSEARLVLAEDYVLAVRARQASVLRHVARNLVPPLVTTYVSFVPTLLSGAIVVEAVYNYDGVGYALWEAARASDFATLLPICTLLVGIVFAANILRDVVIVIVDPRLRT